MTKKIKNQFKNRLKLSMLAVVALAFMACSEADAPTSAAPLDDTNPSATDISSSSNRDGDTSPVDANQLDTTQVDRGNDITDVTGGVGTLVDDMTSQNGSTFDAKGLWFADDDHINAGTSQILDLNGYSMAQGLSISECGVAQNNTGDADEDGMSDCYVGWNVANGDAYNTEGALTAQLDMNEYVNPEGWGWASAGFVLQFEGGLSDTIAQNFSGNEKLQIRFKFPLGEALTIKAREVGYADDGESSPASFVVTGTGQEQLLEFDWSDFTVADWASNTFKPADVWRLSFFKEAAAMMEGSAFPEYMKGPSELNIYCVGFDGACTE